MMISDSLPQMWLIYFGLAAVVLFTGYMAVRMLPRFLRWILVGGIAGMIAVLVAIVASLATIYLPLNNLRVRIARNDITVLRRLLFVPIFHRRLRVSDLSHLSIKRSGSTGQGVDKVRHFKVLAHDRRGGRVTLAEDIDGEDVAGHFRDYLARHLNVESRADEALLTAPLIRALLEAGANREHLGYRDLRALAGLHDVADTQVAGGEDVALLAVDVVQEGDPSVAVRVVLDGGDLGGHAVLDALEVDDAVLLLVAAAAVTRRLAAVAVATTGLGLLREQALLRRGLGDLAEVGDRSRTTCEEAGEGDRGCGVGHAAQESPRPEAAALPGLRLSPPLGSGFQLPGRPFPGDLEYGCRPDCRGL